MMPCLKEAHIELEDIDRHVVERVERRVPAAEIVHGNAETGFAQLGDNADQLFGRLHVCALGYFEMKQIRSDIVALDQQFEKIA